jgi:tRNA(Ile)-lysidine synthase
MSKSELLPIEEIAASQIKKYFPGQETISFVIGVSGGIDSMSLLHILHNLGADLHIIHVNYQKRGSASDKDAALVKRTADKWGVDCEVITVDSDEAKGENFQQWAREVRYTLFNNLFQSTGANGIALAHHQDDQIETILQKVFRGSGLASWSAMQVWDGRLFRPLLSVGRDEIEAYVQKRSIAYRDDESNFTSDFARNFLRNQWLPELEQHFPGWRQNVLRVAEQGRVFTASLRFILQQITDKKDRLDREAFLQLDKKLQKSVLIYYISQADDREVISRGALGELEKLEQLQTGKAIQLTDKLSLMRDRRYLKLVMDTGETGSLLTLQKVDIQEGRILFNGLQFEVRPFKDPDYEHCLYLDWDALEGPLRIRQWRDGDRFQPLGMEGHQTVADHLANRKVNAVDKVDALILESFEETIYAVIFPPNEKRQPPGTISDRVKCGPSTGQCLIITTIL